MKYYTYVLFSPSTGNIYVGYTQNLDKRLAEHNDGLSLSTARYRPWTIALTESHNSRKDAMRREKQLKTSRGRAFIRSILRGSASVS